MIILDVSISNYTKATKNKLNLSGKRKLGSFSCIMRDIRVMLAGEMSAKLPEEMAFRELLDGSRVRVGRRKGRLSLLLQ